MVNILIPQKTIAELSAKRPEILDAATIEQAQKIIDDVKANGEAALRKYATKFDNLSPEQHLVIERDELEKAFLSLSQETQGILERSAARISDFAYAQKACLTELTRDIPGASMGHTITPVQSVGCYAPGGRYPYPSTVLMTVCTAKAAGVPYIMLASPNPRAELLGAAYCAGADRVLASGGASAVSALAYGTELNPPCDMIVGPGNRWLTAAKYCVSKDVGIDMLCGPSELVVVADKSSDPAIVAADLIGQAEHDTDALPILVSTDQALVEEVRKELERQLATLPTADVARSSLTKSYSIVVNSLEEATQAVDAIAPEHLELEIDDAQNAANLFAHAGAIFCGKLSAEVFCDYGLGPNHVLPTSKHARHRAGLSVFTFLRIRTWLKVSDVSLLGNFVQDAAALARIEGLEGHARSVESRKR